MGEMGRRCHRLLAAALAAPALLLGPDEASAGDVAAGEREFARCAGCHEVERREHGIGPHLVGLFGRPAGTVDGYDFSPALTDSGVVWRRATLAAFLADPQGFLPGNRMTAFTGMDSQESLDDLLAYLKLASTLAAEQDSDLVFDGRVVVRESFDGVSDDLATAGLGAAGLQSATPPAVLEPTEPTALELRRLAIWTNYRALVDTSPGGGFGSLYGPGVPLEPEGEAPPELIAGDEFLVFAGERGPSRDVTLMVQVPQSFDPGRPCIVTGPSSGSRGVYGAIGTSGEWGLKRGCAVAYTDKGTGTGAHELTEDLVNLLRGQRVPSVVANGAANFIAPVPPGRQAAFDAETPHRFAFKHAHSRRNPERLWGRNVVRSIHFAFFVLNEAIRPERFPDAEPFTADTTLVIASSVSNGGGASILAAELDREDLIDGIAVSEPKVNPVVDRRFVIRQGEREPLRRHSRSLYDYATLVNVYQGCANLAPENAGAPLNLVPPELGAARCTSLREKGLLSADTLEEQAVEAQAIINQAGILPEQNLVQPSHWLLNVPQAIAVTYANAYGRFSVLRNLCGYSFAATDPASGEPVPLAEAADAILFGTSGGIPPTGGVNLVNNQSIGGPRENRLSISPSTGRTDENLDGALCLRALATGRDPASGRPLTGAALRAHERVQEGIEEIRASGNLRGKPAVIVTGRSDANLPPNHTSRAYFGRNRLVEGQASNLHYYEVLNAQHLDALNSQPGFDTRFVPLHHYFIQGLNLLWDHLTDAAPLPPSQVVRAEPRGGEPGGAPPLGEGDLAPIAAEPDAADRITFTRREVRIPE
jgi:hydroxybutyrate-dimer hydrolase